MQIRVKLTFQFIVLVAGMLILSLCFIYVKFRQMTEDEFYGSLRSKALMTAAMVLSDEHNLRPLGERSETEPESPQLLFRENVTIFNAQMLKVFAFDRNSEHFSPKTFEDIKHTGEARFHIGERHAIGLAYKSRSGQQYVVVAESLFNSEELSRLRNILLVTFFLCIGMVALGGWFYAGQAMAPVAEIVDQVDGIQASDLSARLQAQNNRDEIARLVFTFNRLLDRIQFAFKMQKSFISNVSHELKNPLSVIIAQLEVALNQNRDEQEYRSTLQSVLEDTRELSTITERLLQLAKVHSEGANITFERIRLDELMLQTRASLLRLRPDYQVSFDIIGFPEDEEQLCIRGNEPLLRTAFQNLMDNGCKFSPEKKVDVRIIFDASGKHQVEISDCGPGIPAKDLQQIFQPFYRSSESIQVRGSGIGLSLVDSIMKLHQVALEVVTKKGKGTTFRLNFPALQAG
jgi:signal transduction histidine kinase